MTSQQHLGVFLLLMTIFNIIGVFDSDTGKGKKYEWYIPSGAAIVVFIMFECLYWPFYLIVG